MTDISAAHTVIRPPSFGDSGGRSRPWIPPLLALAGLGLLALLLYRVGWGNLVSSFQRLGGSALLLLLGLGVIEHLVNCEASRRAMLGRIGLGWTIVSTSAGALTNLVIPFEAGEFLKAALLRQRSNDTRVVSGLVIWNYIWKLAKPSTVAACFLLSLLLGNAYPSTLGLPVLVGVALSFAPYFGLRVLLRRHPAERLLRLFARIPHLGKRALGWMADASRLDGEIRDFSRNHPRTFVEVFTLTVLARLPSVAALYVMASRLGLPADLGSVAFLYAAQIWERACFNN